MAITDGGNSPPRFTRSVPDLVFVEGRQGRFEIPSDWVEDAQGDGIKFTWSAVFGELPTWLTPDGLSANQIGGTPPAGSPNLVIEVTPSDGDLSGAPARFTLITLAPSANQAPIVALRPDEQVWTEGTPGTYVLPASTFVDPDGDALTVGVRLNSGAALPSWLGFNAATRSFSGTPPSGSPDYTIRITAADPGGASATTDLVLRTSTVAPPTHVGTAGPDSIEGTAGADVMRALAGNDIVSAGAGDDLIDGGEGSDRLNGGAGNDVALYGGTRSDYLLGRTSVGVVTVTDRAGAMDTLTEIETLQIGDERIATSSLTYLPAVDQPPEGAVNLVYRFYNARDRAYFYTPSSTEREMVIRESTDPSYTPENGIWPYFYEGATFGTAGAGSLPVYRFYNTQTGHHFFTLSEAERALIVRQSTDPTYTPEEGLWPFVAEGIGFAAFAGAGHAGSAPVYRFYSPALNRHFFTASADEAQQIRLTGQWTDEGIGFWGSAVTGNRAPVLSTPLVDQVWALGRPGSYQFTSASFSDADGDSLDYQATTTSGGSLPSWLSFSSATRIFTGTPPAGTPDLAVRVTASDGRGASATDDFTIAARAAAADDYAGNTSTGGSVAAGGTVTGSIETGGDTDWLRVSLVAGRTYTLKLEGSANGNGTLADPFLLGVYDSAGRAIANTSNDDFDGTPNARVVFTPASSGDYFVAAGAFGASTGTYRLTVAQDDFAASTATTGLVSAGGSVGGVIEAAGDADWFRVALSPGRTYTIVVEGSPGGAGTLADPSLLGIYDGTGRLLANTTNNDISGSNRNASVAFAPAAGGDYFIAAAGNGSATGSYRLSVQQEDYESSIATTGRLEVGGAASGTIEIAGDADWFRVPLVAGRVYLFKLGGSDDGKGTLADPALLGIYDSTGRELANTSNNDIGGGDRTARVMFTPTVSGDYFVSAGGNAGSTGSYQVSVRQDDYDANPSTAGAVADGPAGTIEVAGDVDWFRASLVSGQIYSINLEGSFSASGTLANPLLAGVFDSSGAPIPGTGNDDISAIDRNAHVSFSPPVSGEYFIAAASSAGTTGTYRLRVTSDDYAAGPSTTGVAAVDAVTIGNAEAAGDVDWFRVPLIAGRNYAVNLEGAVGGLAALGNPALLGVFDGFGNPIANSSNDDIGAFDRNAHVGFSPATSGDYFVAAAASGSITGSYRLLVRFDDYASTTATAGTVSAGSSAVGAIETAGDADWFRVSLAAGRAYAINVEGAPNGNGTLSNPFLLGVYDTSGSLIPGTTNDDLGSNRNSGVTFTPTFGGDYYVAAGSSGSVTGTYRVSIIQDDYAANPTTTGAVAAGSSATGAIDVAGDADWFRISLVAGRTYTFDLAGATTGAGTLGNPALVGLYDISGRLLPGTTNDDFGSSLNARVSYTPTSGGDYFISAGAAGAGTGTYRLSVASAAVDDYSADTATTGRATAGGASTGTIDAPGDADWFRITLVAGRTYTVSLDGAPSGAGTLADPWLMGIYNSAGVLQANTSNDDFGGTLNSRVSFTPTSGGDYFIAAAAIGSLTGTYRLSVAGAVSDDYAANVSSSGRVSVGSSTTGSIEASGDADWFRVTLSSGRVYAINLEGSPTSAGTLSDPLVTGIHTSAGALVASTGDDDSGEGTNSRVMFTPPSTGDYFVSAAAFDLATGTYRLSVTSLDDYSAGTVTAGRVSAGGSVTGVVESAGDADWFRVTLTGGRVYTINLAGNPVGNSQLPDTLLNGVYDSLGRLLPGTTNDDIGLGDLNSRVVFTPSASGDYFISAGAFGSNVGTYRLSVSLPGGGGGPGVGPTAWVGDDGAAADAHPLTGVESWAPAPLEGGVLPTLVGMAGPDTGYACQDPLHGTGLV